MNLRPAALTLVPTALTFASAAWSQDPPPAAPADPAPAPAVEAEASTQIDLAAQVQAPAAPAAPDPAAPADVAAPPAFDVKVDFGIGLRTEFAMDPDAEPESPLFRMAHNFRPYIAGQVHDYIKFEANMDANSGADTVGVNVLDAIIKFEFNDYFNIWTGRFLPPSDRSNLSGPYFLNAWNYPNGTHIYPAAYAGRDDGLAYWGQYNGGQFKWQLGFFDMGAGGGNANPRFSGRLVFNALDPEPGYYNSSTYYGTKDILAFGAVLHHRPAPEGQEDSDTLWNLDALYENSFPGTGTLNVEGAFYGFGGNDTGTSFSLLGSFLFQDRIGIGQLQPMVRLQRAAVSDGDSFAGPLTITAPPDGDASLLTIDAGLHYIINGHNTRLAATIQHASPDVDGLDVDSNTLFFLGAQIQAF